MKHLLVAISFLAFAFFGKAQADNKIVIGSVDSIQSKILNENRKIWVYVPPNDGTSEKFEKQRYPVVYLTDGNYHFIHVVSMIQQLHPLWGDPVCPNMIVVGIPNTDRIRDLTPTHAIYDPSDSTSGWGENFISFIEKELMPYVDKKYPTESYKILVGHSLGGLAVMQTFVHHTNLFNSYITIDPSIWWDNHAIIKEAQSKFKHKKFQGTSLFIAFSSVFTPGSIINDAGYSALSAKKYKMAEDLFNINLDRYPGSYKVYVAMGDYYADIGDKPNAIINYNKSLAIEEISDIRKKLEKVQIK